MKKKRSVLTPVANGLMICVCALFVPISCRAYFITSACEFYSGGSGLHCNDWAQVYLGILAQKWKKDNDRARQFYLRVCTPYQWSLRNVVRGMGSCQVPRPTEVVMCKCHSEI